MTADMSGLTDREVLATWVAALEELRRRDIVRSANNPTGDYAERLVAHALGLTLLTNANAGYDAIDSNGTRYQIKSRRLLSPTSSHQLGQIRNLLADDPKPFDVLIVVLFGPSFDVIDCLRMPIEVVREYAKYRAHVNAHVLRAHGTLLADPRVTRLDLRSG
jgi:hypothetical protein